MQYDHLCRRHSCVFPGHGDIVPPEINKQRGYSPAARYARRKKCNSGHPLDGRTRDSKSGKMIRYCKTCARERMAARKVPRGPAPLRTHCNSGKHPWVAGNIYTDPKKGTQTCKACKIERQQEAREAAKQAA